MDVKTVVVRQASTNPIRTVVVKQTIGSTVRTVVVKQAVPNTIPTIVIKRGDNPIKTVIINKGQRGEPGPPGPAGAVTDATLERVLLSSEDVANKSFSLNYTPGDPSKIELTPVGGIVQIYGIDYVYSEGKISWGGLGLDGFLEASEYIIVRYLKEA